MYNKCGWKTKLSNSEFIHPVGPAPDRGGKPWTQCWRTGCSRDLDIKGSTRGLKKNIIMHLKLAHVTKCYTGDQGKEDDMGKTCSMYGFI
jgi:hypothetical protein